MVVRSPQDVYARHVVSSRGYPIWTPEPSTELLSYRPEGLRIGDVGVVVPENGSFHVFFNLCLPKDYHPHRLIGAPPEFDPVELSDADIETVPNAEDAGQVFTASRVTRVENDSPSTSSQTPASAAGQFTFHMPSSESALLILPEGAERHDVRDPRPFFEQASRHAATWHQFAEEHFGRLVSHDAIYVITGFHKARSWSVAGYPHEQGSSDWSAQFTIGTQEGGNTAAGYCWESSRSLEWRAGPLDKGIGVANQAVFIRGFKIALRNAARGVPQTRADLGPGVGPSHGESYLDDSGKAVSKTADVSSQAADRNAGPDPGENTVVNARIQHIPEIASVFHPTDIINQYILLQEPSAQVAITHDSVWGSIIDKKLLRPEELVHGELLTRVVSEKYTIALRNGVAHLQSKSDLDAIMDPTNKQTEVKGTNQAVQHSNPTSLSVVSESSYRCTDETSLPPDRQPTDLHKISSKYGVTSGVARTPSPRSLRTVKIIVISDYVCAFCYICDKVIQRAIAACQDLPLSFDVEFRPFTLVNPASLPVTNPNQVVYRNAYLIERFGREQTEIKLKAVSEFGQKTGLRFKEDGILCATTQAHRLSAKAYKLGGQDLQRKFNESIFEAGLARGADISDESLLVDAAANVGLMNKEQATGFLRSTEYLDCVEKTVEAARAQGINGVPFVIIDGKWAVNGLQSAECFIQIFRKLAQLPTPPVGSGKPKTASEVGVH